MAGDESPRSPSHLYCPPGGSRGDVHSLESDTPSSFGIESHEDGNGDLQQSCMDVECAPASPKLSVPCNSFLPHPNFGNPTTTPSTDPQPYRNPLSSPCVLEYAGGGSLVPPQDDAGTTPRCNPPLPNIDTVRVNRQQGCAETHQHIIDLSGITDELNPSSSSDYQYPRNRKNTRNNERNSNRDLSIKRNKNNDIQRDIRQKIHPYMSIESLKKIDRYQDPIQPRCREICPNNESKNAEQSECLGENNKECSTDQLTISEQINESNNMKL